jgi:hypothetical protein
MIPSLFSERGKMLAPIKNRILESASYLAMRLWEHLAHYGIGYRGITHGMMEKFYTPCIPFGLYYIIRDSEERSATFISPFLRYTIPYTIPQAKYSLSCEGHPYPYAIITNGPPQLAVEIRKRGTALHPTSIITVIPANVLVETYLQLN